MNRLLLILVLFTFIGFEGCSKNDENKTVGESSYVPQETNQSGDIKGPDFTLTSTEGQEIKLSDYKGKIIVLDFWATWCPPCRKGIPDLISIQKEYPEDVVILGISLDTQTKADVVPFMKKIGINYPVVYGNMEVTQLYGGVDAIPTSFIIDQKGNIVAQHVGLVAKSEYTNKIKKLLDSKS